MLFSVAVAAALRLFSSLHVDTPFLCAHDPVGPTHLQRVHILLGRFADFETPPIRRASNRIRPVRRDGERRTDRYDDVDRHNISHAECSDLRKSLRGAFRKISTGRDKPLCRIQHLHFVLHRCLRLDFSEGDATPQQYHGQQQGEEQKQKLCSDSCGEKRSTTLVSVRK